MSDEKTYGQSVERRLDHSQALEAMDTMCFELELSGDQLGRLIDLGESASSLLPAHVWGDASVSPDRIAHAIFVATAAVAERFPELVADDSEVDHDNVKLLTTLATLAAQRVVDLDAFLAEMDDSKFDESDDQTTILTNRLKQVLAASLNHDLDVDQEKDDEALWFMDQVEHDEEDEHDEDDDDGEEFDDLDEFDSGNQSTDEGSRPGRHIEGQSEF